MFTCCNIRFDNPSAYHRHLNSHSTYFQCEFCQLRYTTEPQRNRHSERCHQSSHRYQCFKCFNNFASKDARNLHSQTCSNQRGAANINAPANQNSAPSTNFELVESSIGNRVQNYNYEFPQSPFNYDTLHNVFYNQLSTFIGEQNRSFKLQIVLTLTFYKIVDTTQVTNPPVHFRSETLTFYPHAPRNEIDSKLEVVLENLKHQLEEFQTHGSGWAIEQFHRITLECTDTDWFRTGSYIELPPELAKHPKCLTNIENNDHYCLLYCLVAHKYRTSPIPHKTRVNFYKSRLNEIHYEGLLHSLQLILI